MTAITTQHLTLQDYLWLEKKLREEFDEPREVYQINADLEIIERAERFGLFELAGRMRNDIMINVHQKQTA